MNDTELCEDLAELLDDSDDHDGDDDDGRRAALPSFVEEQARLDALRERFKRHLNARFARKVV